MAVFDHSASQQSGFVSVLANRVVRAGASLLRAWNHRRQFRHLREMSDWELADIGLQRDDLRDAWKSRVDTDPLRYLSAVARTRGTVEDAARRVF